MFDAIKMPSSQTASREKRTFPILLLAAGTAVVLSPQMKEAIMDASRAAQEEICKRESSSCLTLHGAVTKRLGPGPADSLPQRTPDS